MDNRNEVRQFLATRRAKITPEQAGLPFYGGNRRVPGLRRAILRSMSFCDTCVAPRYSNGPTG